MSGRGGELTLDDGRPLSSLRVVDLKEELEKRSLSKSGSKKDLVDRLKKHVLIEKQREDAAGRSDGLPNISMQDKLAEQNPFIREYFESQAQEFHSQTVVKELYQVESQLGIEQVREEPAPAPAPEPAPAVEKMVILDPVPEKEEVQPKPEEPPAPVVEAKAVEPPVVFARKSSSSPPKPTQIVIDEKKGLNDTSELTTKTAPVPQEDEVQAKPKEPPVPPVVETKVIEPPVPAPAVVEMVTIDPVPQKEEIQAKPEEPPAPPPVVETKVVQPPIIFARKSSVPEAVPMDTEEKKGLTDIPELTKKSSSDDQPKKMEIAPIVFDVVEKKSRRRRFDVEPTNPPETPSEKKEEEQESKQPPDPDPTPTPAPPVVVHVQTRRASRDEVNKSKNVLKERTRITFEPLVPHETPSERKKEEESKSEKLEHPAPAPPEKEKESSRNVLKDRRRRFEPAISEETPSETKTKEPEQESEQPTVLTRRASQEEVKKSQRSRRFESQSSISDEPPTEKKSKEEEKVAEHPVVPTRQTSQEEVKKSQRSRRFESHSSIPDETPSEKKTKEEVAQKESQSDPPVVSARRKSTSQEKGVVKRAVSIRSTEGGIDEDALDYGDEDKGLKEPQKFIWTPRILRLNSNFNNNKSDESTETSATASWKKPGKEETEIRQSDSDETSLITDHTNTYISSGLLVTFFPEADLIAESELKLEERSPGRSEGSSLQHITRTIPNETEEEEEDDGDEAMEMGVGDEDIEGHAPSHIVDKNGDLDSEHAERKQDLRNKVEVSLKRKISINPLPTEEEVQKELTPPRHSLSNVIIVTNLVRPFTVIQLRELLQRTGNITDFWLDKIKSKCVAKFEKEDEAFETRAALHGVRWPTSNPKTLHVDFTSEERLENLRERETRNDVKPKEEEKPQKAQMLPVREWDLGKRGRSRSPAGGQQRRRSSKSLSPDRKRTRRGSPESSRVSRNSRSSPQRDRRGREGEVKKEPEMSGKALDELFRKTVAVPCIYWLPLNPQQIAEKEELRRKRMIERERRISEIGKLRSR